MPVSNINNDLRNNMSRPAPVPIVPGDNFQKILQSQKNKTVPISLPSGNADQKLDHKVFLGVINKNHPTVSHLLTQSQAFKEEAWNILLSDINKDKPFNKIPKGSEIEINQQTNEITWHKATKKPPTMNAEILAKQDLNDNGEIIIGQICHKMPTVSHLLRHNKLYHDDAWNIILSDINRDKPFTSLRSGTTITINPKTFELSFNNNGHKIAHSPKTINPAAQEILHIANNNFLAANKNFSQHLVESVRPYIGRPYKQIDCYGLLVRGLKNQGIQYGGTGGLRESLEQIALQHGRPLNAYQNGEGLIKAAGKTIFARSFNQVTQPNNLAKQTFTEINPHLQEGMILSFSTPSRGHTGIIACHKGQWTYINSGLIDHQVNPGNLSRGVGEEVLEGEIADWFNLAKDRKESLQVTMGMLDENKLRFFNKDTPRFARTDSK